VTDYAAKKNALRRQLLIARGQLRLEKSTVSNLFRYQARRTTARGLRLGHFNQVIAIDQAARTLDTEGLATFETVVACCLPGGFLPLVTPELKHITVGGATVGIGIESSGFRHGFVHDALIEAEVLLPGGDIVICTADNEYADLFHALPNSYGTLGYILRARLRLLPALPYVHLQIGRFDSTSAYLDGMRAATARGDVDFIEGLFFGDRRFYLVIGRFTGRVPRADDILRRNVYYRLIESRQDIYLATADYIFRYDPDWFWNLPETAFYGLFRRLAPKRWRNSGFYTRFVALKRRAPSLLPDGAALRTEPLIQDWEVPWDAAGELIEFCLREVSLDGRPWAVVPIRAGKQPTLYPLRAGELYLNLGCYCHVRRQPGREPYHDTLAMDRKCFELGGIKMLYSSTFLDEPEFDARFNGAAYRLLKKKYDPHGLAPRLYDKVCGQAMPAGA
jgi:FAD/FMN-containing dehydrogenase